MAMATFCCLLPAFSIIRASATGRKEPNNATAGAAWKLPARDRRIDFGKHRGRMLGTLPRSYLVWMANKLQGSEETMWADWAEEVLEDPHYADKLEWEKLESELLKGNGLHHQLHQWRMLNRNGNGAGNTLNGKMRAYGWDLDSKDGWNKVNITLLGTSKGGRIPRTGGSSRLPKYSSAPSLGSHAADDNTSEDELMQRRRMRRTRNSDRQNPQEEEVVSIAPPITQDLSPFPGRGALLKRFNTQ